MTAKASSAKRRAARRPFRRQQAGKGGHEGGVERALAEQAAEQVGQLERDEERIRHRPGAQHRRDQHIAREAQHAAGHGPAADGEDAAQHLCGGAPARIFFRFPAGYRFESRAQPFPLIPAQAGIQHSCQTRA